MLNTLEPFLQRVFIRLDEMGVDVSGFVLDHVCYRVETLVQYEAYKHSWRMWVANHEPYESPVNGRPITVFVLAVPPIVCGRLIPAIELPAPKEGSPYPEGWEHAEFVIGEPFKAFRDRHPKLVFDEKGLDKEINPELGLKLGNGMQVKFHHRTLADVIEIEKAIEAGMVP